MLWQAYHEQDRGFWRAGGAGQRPTSNLWGDQANTPIHARGLK